jgi:preprotein translocase subunit SecF
VEFIKNPQFEFLGRAKYFVTMSLALIAMSIFLIAAGRLRYGVEFSGGTQLVLTFEKAPEIDKIRDAVDTVAKGAVLQTFGPLADHKVLVRIAGEAEESDLDASAVKVKDVLAQRYPQNAVLESSSEIVGPVVGAELRQKAILLTVLGLLFQLIYIGVRFKGGIWGAGATIAAFHDVIICLGFLTLFGYEITLNVIAALLTLVGYSVNDTIVIFDRARENLRQRRKDPLPKLLNDSINQTLTRTLISSGTTFLAVLALYLFGGEVLRGFGFTMVIGIIVGTYSTIFIAIPLVNWWYARAAKSGRAPAKAAL